MRVRSYTRRSNKPVAHEVNQCTRPVGTTRRRRAHRFWREIKVARPGDGEEPISIHGKGAKRVRSRSMRDPRETIFHNEIRKDLEGDPYRDPYVR